MNEGVRVDLLTNKYHLNNWMLCLMPQYGRLAAATIKVGYLRLSRKKMFFSADKAKRLLGFNPRPIDEAFQDALDWFQQNGYVR